MKALALIACLLCASCVEQSPEAAKYADRPVMLVDHTPGTEGVVIWLFNEGGQEHLEFVPTSKTKEAADRGGKPITLGYVLSALGAATDKINQLQAENDRLWKLAMKDAPKPTTVVVQQPTAPQPDPDAARRQAILMMMMQNRPAPSQNINVQYSNCTKYPALCAGR